MTVVAIRVLDQDVSYRRGGADGVTFPARVEVWVPEAPDAETELVEALRSWSSHLRGLGMVLAEGGRFGRAERDGGPARVFTGTVLVL